MTPAATETTDRGEPADRLHAVERIVIVGAGMAGARLAEELRRTDPGGERLAVTVLGEEPEEPYNRIMLSHVVAGGLGDPSETRLKPAGWWGRQGVDLRTDAAVTALDRDRRRVMLTSGEAIGYDRLVLATGAAAALPPIRGAADDEGRAAPGVHRLRDAADCRALSARLEAVDGPIALVGGGFIGLEVACALTRGGRDVTVVHPRPWPMDTHLDEGAGRVLSRALDGLGVRVVTGARGAEWSEAGLGLDDGRVVPAATLVLSAGTRPRTALAAGSGLEVGRGIVVDAGLATSDPRVYALGDCAEVDGRVSGLVGPAWDQARALAARLTGGAAAAPGGGAEITRLKAHGVDVVALGALAEDVYAPGTDVTCVSEPGRGRYARVDVRDGRVIGAVLVGHPEPVGALTQLYEHALPVPDDVSAVILGRAPAEAAADPSPARMPGSAVVCRCNGVSKKDLVGAFTAGATDPAALAGATRAGTGCGGCTGAVEGICAWLAEASPDGTGAAGDDSGEAETPAAASDDPPARECA